MLERIEIRRYALLFILAFLLNLIWEHVHYILYLHYKGGTITEWVLLHATVMDAFYIVGAVFCIRVFQLQHKRAILVILLTLLAIGVERWALATHRWAYGPKMPVVPFIDTGLTPTIQLALLGLLAYSIVFQNEDSGSGKSYVSN